MSLTKYKTIKINGLTISARTEIYNSVTAFSNDLAYRSLIIPKYDIGRIASQIYGDWTGVNCYEEALDLLNKGYKPALDELKKTMKEHLVDAPRVAFSNEVVGFAPVVPLVLNGVPKCMAGSCIKRNGKVLDIYYDNTMPCGVTKEEMIDAGNALLKVLIKLEKQGYKFNLYAVESYCGREHHMFGNDTKTADVLCIKLKGSDRPMDIRRISFPLTHPAFFRVIGFDWQGKSPITRDIGLDRGTSMYHHYTAQEQMAIAKSLFGPRAIYISANYVKDVEYSLEHINDLITDRIAELKEKDEYEELDSLTQVVEPAKRYVNRRPSDRYHAEITDEPPLPVGDIGFDIRDIRYEPYSEVTRGPNRAERRGKVDITADDLMGWLRTNQGRYGGYGFDHR